MSSFEELTGDPEFPRKLLDHKKYVRVDPSTGEPQLISVDPMIADDGELMIDTVIVTIDDGPQMVMERGSADAYIESQNCVPLEITAQWKHKKVN
jgi:hypothetical protein